jgi:DNA-binding NtrC family response regulator
MPASILTVDDEDTTTIALELLLRDHGYEVKSAVNAAEAQALLARHWFDLVFLDLRLPDADGITLLEEIKRIAPETEVVLMTLFFSAWEKNSRRYSRRRRQTAGRRTCFCSARLAEKNSRPSAPR